MAYLEIQNLTKKYGENEGIENLSFSLEKGKILTILGASGSGKTTFLRCLVGLSLSDRGSMALQGFPLNSASSAENQTPRVGLVFQNFHLFPHLNVLENITIAPSLIGKKQTLFKRKSKVNQATLQAAERLLDLVGMSSKKNAYPCDLSGGQQQRVAIARALALNPEILAFDEPTSALDPALRKDVVRLFQDLRGGGKTMIVVTHDLDFAKEVSDEVIVLKEGKIQAFLTAKDVQNSEALSLFESYFSV